MKQFIFLILSGMRHLSVNYFFVILFLALACSHVTNAHKINGFKYAIVKESGNMYGVEENVTNLFKKMGFEIISEDQIARMSNVDKSKILLVDYEWKIVYSNPSTLDLFLRDLSGKEIFRASGNGMSFTAKGDMKRAFNKISKTISNLKYSYDPNMNKEIILNSGSQLANKPSENEMPKNDFKTSDVDIDIPINNINNKNTFAIIFANENYQEESLVEYALNDGESFKNYCNKVLGIPEKNIHYRKNATKNNIIAEISWLQKVSKAFKGTARFIVYYAGHGIPDEKTGTSYILPVDGNGSMLETGYSLKQLYKELGEMPSAGITIFMDACFSGTKRGEGMLASARGIAIKVKQQKLQGKMVVFSAAQEDETAYPFNEENHGLFTYFLLKKLKETKGNVSLEELGNYIIEKVSQESIVSNGKSQTPCVSASPTFSNEWKSIKLK